MFSRGRIFIIQGDGSQKHHTEIMKWERGDYNQAKRKTLEPSDYEVFVFLVFSYPCIGGSDLQLSSICGAKQEGAVLV